MLLIAREKATDRQLRFFAVACCRKVWYLLGNDRCRTAVEIAEQFADNLESADELNSARELLRRSRPVARGFLSPSQDSRKGASFYAAEYTAITKMWHVDKVAHAATVLAARSGISLFQCKWLRDVAGPTLFRPVTADPAWLTSTVVSLAQGIYDERAFERMPILADALEDAGCTSAEILDHCRQPGEHVRGCWVVDLVLGKS
jgi:hypothetical protein